VRGLRFAEVEADLPVREDLEVVVLEMEAVLRPAAGSVGPFAARLQRLVRGQPDDRHERRAQVGGGVQIAALLGIAQQRRHAERQLGELALIQHCPQENELGAVPDLARRTGRGSDHLRDVT